MILISKIMKKLFILCLFPVALLGSFCIKNDKSENLKAIEKYNIQIKENPNSSWNYTFRGNSYFRLKNYDMAIKDYQKALSTNKHRSIYYYLAMAYLAKNLIDDSFISINEALKLESDSFAFHSLRGICYDLMKKYNKAINDYTFFLKRKYAGNSSFEYHIVFIRRSILHFLNQKYEESLSDLNNAVKIDERNLDDVYYLKFKIFTKKGDMSQAQEFLIKALKEGFNDQKLIYSFIDSDENVDKKKIKKIVAENIKKGSPINGFDFDNREFIINRYLNIK